MQEKKRYIPPKVKSLYITFTQHELLKQIERGGKKGLKDILFVMCKEQLLDCDSN